MKTKLILRVRQIDDTSFLDDYGNIIFKDDIIDVVILETDESHIDELKNHPKIINVQENRKGTLLEVNSA